MELLTLDQHATTADWERASLYLLVPQGSDMVDSSAPPRSIPATIAVANAKGGVGKTSIVANLAGVAAARGLKVLAIDLDPQGNLATDLGYKDRTDLGDSLASVFRGVDRPTTLREVRPGLDVWAGGPHLSNSVLSTLIPASAHPLADALAAQQGRYDIALLDCPPAMGPLVDAALTVADYLVVPIRADHASLDGLELIRGRIDQARAQNPGLELMGITIFGVSRTATALASEVAIALRQSFKGIDLRVLPAVRRSERAAFEMRARGELAQEHAVRYPPGSPAANLAADYAALAERVIDVAVARRRTARSAEHTAVGSRDRPGPAGLSCSVEVPSIGTDPIDYGYEPSWSALRRA